MVIIRNFHGKLQLDSMVHDTLDHEYENVQDKRRENTDSEIPETHFQGLGIARIHCSIPVQKAGGRTLND